MAAAPATEGCSKHKVTLPTLLINLCSNKGLHVLRESLSIPRCLQTSAGHVRTQQMERHVYIISLKGEEGAASMRAPSDLESPTIWDLYHYIIIIIIII